MSVSKYDTDVDPASNTSHAMMLRLVGSNKRVLDVGCSTGYLARALREQGCQVSGVEYDEASAEQAAPVLDKLVVGDLEHLDLPAEFAGEQFDAIVFGDVLEHLRDPLPVLRSVRDLLRPGGSVVISVPNIAHADVRLALLQGKFQYRDLGLLDVTHVRFFTRASLRSFLEEAGFTAVDVQTTTADVLTTELADDAKGVDPAIIEQLRQDIDATTYQFIVRAVRDDAVQLAAETAWRASESEKRLNAARAEVEELRAELARLQQDVSDVDGLRSELAALREQEAHLRSEVEAIYRTKIMRAGKLPRAFWRVLREPR